MKRFLFSAVALIGFTVASYGANTVEVNENLLVEEKVEVVVVASADMGCLNTFSTVYNHNADLVGEYLALWFANLAYVTCLRETGESRIIVSN